MYSFAVVGSLILVMTLTLTFYRWPWKPFHFSNVHSHDGKFIAVRPISTEITRHVKYVLNDGQPDGQTENIMPSPPAGGDGGIGNVNQQVLIQYLDLWVCLWLCTEHHHSLDVVYWTAERHAFIRCSGIRSIVYAWIKCIHTSGIIARIYGC